MISILIWLAVFCSSFLMSLYVFDDPTFYDNPPVNPRKATVYDLQEGASRYTIDKYINEHIIPSDNYFDLRNEFESSRDAGDSLYTLFMWIAPVVLMIRSLFVFYIDSKGYGITVLICVAGIVLCVLIGWVLSKLYCKYLKVPEMHLDDTYFQNHIAQIDDLFCVGEQKAQANYMTLVYYNYYVQIMHTMRKRIALKSVVTGICAAIYFLFFFRSGYD